MLELKESQVAYLAYLLTLEIVGSIAFNDYLFKCVKKVLCIDILGPFSLGQWMSF